VFRKCDLEKVPPGKRGRRPLGNQGLSKGREGRIRVLMQKKRKATNRRAALWIQKGEGGGVSEKREQAPGSEPKY